MTNPTRKRVVTLDDLNVLNQNAAYARQKGEEASAAAQLADTARQNLEVLGGDTQAAGEQATQAAQAATLAKNTATAAALQASQAAGDAVTAAELAEGAAGSANQAAGAATTAAQRVTDAVLDLTDIKVDIAQSAALATAAAGITPRNNLAAITGPDGYYRAMDTGYVYQRAGGSNTRRADLEALSRKSIRDVFPEAYGAVGDRVTDDTAALNALIADNDRARIIISRPYRITSRLLVQGKSLSWIFLGDGELYSDPGTISHALHLMQCSNFKIEGPKITGRTRNDLARQFVQTPDINGVNSFNSMAGIFIEHSQRFQVMRGELTYWTDAVSINYSSNFQVEGVDTHELGEEGFAIRYSSNYALRKSRVHNHNGDAILIKGEGGIIEGNDIYDGVTTYGEPTVIGGGITCNTEDGATTPIRKLRIRANQVRNVQYGIGLIGGQDFEITGNTLDTLLVGRGIDVNNSLAFNPNGIESGYSIISNNIVQNVLSSQGIFLRSGAVQVRPCVISGNRVSIASDSPTDAAIIASNATVTGNIITGVTGAPCNGIDAINSAVSGNRLEGQFNVPLILNGCATTGNDLAVTSGDASAKIYGQSVFVGNKITGTQPIQARADFDGVLSNNRVDAGAANALAIFDGAAGVIGPNRLLSTGAVIADNQVTRTITIDAANYGLKNWRAGVAPTTGTHKLGDVVWNTSPAEGQPLGFVCVVAGTPGTWLQFGLVTALANQPILKGMTLNNVVNTQQEILFRWDGKTRYALRQTTGNNLQFIPRDANETLLPIFFEFTGAELQLLNYPVRLGGTFDKPLRLSNTYVFAGNGNRLRYATSAPGAITDGVQLQDCSAGPTANRPTTTVAGQQFFDTTLGKPIWRNGTNAAWVDATGATV
ncbi:right-handed parallel beta-helix repeat-containing protein [Deinococcus sp.]|uniref:right-handed parallel beta-helix repeat-containing protein n=1 Tax=Deinococcus sp. TaxID=47478 RepID=UPI00391AFC87